MPSGYLETIEKTFEETATFDFKEDKPRKKRATELLEDIGIINESKHQTDFLQTIDSFFAGLVSLKLILYR